MNTLELKERKNTTRNAVTAALDFFENFDMSSAEDIVNIMSPWFSITFDLNGNGYVINKARFVNDAGIIKIDAYAETEKFYELKIAFDGTTEYINFKEMMHAFEVFVNKINENIVEKEDDITGFLDFIENYNNFRKSEEKTEII